MTTAFLADWNLKLLKMSQSASFQSTLSSLCKLRKCKTGSSSVYVLPVSLGMNKNNQNNNGVFVTQCNMQDSLAPIIHLAQCGARRNASGFASFSPSEFSFTSCTTLFKSQMHLCTHWCSGALLVCCYFEATTIDCAINQLKPGLKSMQCMLVLCAYTCRCVHSLRTFCLFHAAAHKHAKIKNKWITV